MPNKPTSEREYTESERTFVIDESATELSKQGLRYKKRKHIVVTKKREVKTGLMAIH